MKAIRVWLVFPPYPNLENQIVTNFDIYVQVEKHSDTNGDAKLTNGGSSEPTGEPTPAEPEEAKAPTEVQSSLNIQQPTEQLPAELLQVQRLETKHIITNLNLLTKF